MNSIKEFYDQHHFPGPYGLEQLKKYEISINRYVNLINQYIDNDQRVLDLGCGTGLLTNLFALRYSSQFIGVDFSTAADYADKFAVDNNIKNVKFINQDFFKFKTKVSHQNFYFIDY
jgi:cyclopropane fatty-acyl-phospholipid synthase-like methyltransferase